MTKNKRLIYTALIGLMCLSSANAQQPTKQHIQIIEDGIRFCESTYPYKGGILIANFGTQELNPLNTSTDKTSLYITNWSPAGLSKPERLFLYLSNWIKP